MALSQDELQSIINAVISSIRTNSKTIGQLTPATLLEDTDCFEIDGGKKVSFSLLKDAIKNIIESLKTRRIIIFDEVSKQGTIKMLSSVDTDLVIAWVESEKRFGARKNQGSGLVPINPEYYSNWRGREKWCDTYGKPYGDVLYVCDGTIYVASEDLSGLVALLPQELEAWRDSISEAVSELQRLVDESTGAIIPDLDIGFSVDLI